MSDFLHRLAARSQPSVKEGVTGRQSMPRLMPRVPSRFEPSEEEPTGYGAPGLVEMPEGEAAPLVGQRTRGRHERATMPPELDREERTPALYAAPRPALQTAQWLPEPDPPTLTARQLPPVQAVARAGTVPPAGVQERTAQKERSVETIRREVTETVRKETAVQTAVSVTLPPRAAGAGEQGQRRAEQQAESKGARSEPPRPAVLRPQQREAEPERQTRPESRRAAEPPQPVRPEVHVTIGRIEVRAAPASREEKAVAPLPPVVSSLEDYLLRRTRG